MEPQRSASVGTDVVMRAARCELRVLVRHSHKPRTRRRPLSEALQRLSLTQSGLLRQLQEQLPAGSSIQGRAALSGEFV